MAIESEVGEAIDDRSHRASGDDAAQGSHAQPGPNHLAHNIPTAGHAAIKQDHNQPETRNPLGLIKRDQGLAVTEKIGKQQAQNQDQQHARQLELFSDALKHQRKQQQATKHNHVIIGFLLH